MTIEEAQAWEIVIACWGQVRIGPSGLPMGLDMAAVRSVMQARGCDNPDVLELVMAAEGAMVGAVGSDR